MTDATLPDLFEGLPMLQEPPIVLVVCGGRQPVDARAVVDEATARLGRMRIDTLFHGAARGVDIIVAEVADQLGIPAVGVPADWETGPSAGPRRNRMMLAVARAHARWRGREYVLLAFRGGRGTANCVSAAAELGYQIIKADT